jgi:AraC family transcriptional regulator of adaptative response / DNA-3-methyladenine glycosylase II
MRATSIPAAIMSFSVASLSEAGPMVAMIFVRRGTAPRYPQVAFPPAQITRLVFAVLVLLDFDACYGACRARDPRFDGWFFIGVTSTGIYCRPSCPATTPKRANVRFYPTAAAAQQAGFRACRRCRPDASPGSPEWDTRADVVARAMRAIADGVVDREGVEGLARRLGYGVRQVERLVRAELGTGPLAIARAQRAQTARVLIETTDLSFAEIAFAAGFSSIRQFNATVQQVFARTPTDLRGRRPRSDLGGQELRVRLAHRQPLSADGMLERLARNAVPGVEELDPASMTYRRSLDLPLGGAVVALTPRVDHVECRVWLADLRDLPAAVARSRWLLDLDADPVAIDAHLAADPLLAPLVAKDAGRRVARTPDGAELALRAVLGQQVSTAAGARHAARLVAAVGRPLAAPIGSVTHLFPSPGAVAAAPDDCFRMPDARRRTMRRLAEALASGDLVLTPDTDRAEAEHQLSRLPGIGPWTASVVAMRALGDPDAFPVDDLALRRRAAELGLGRTRRDLLARSAAWRPWRAYAAQHLWRTP